MGYVIGIDLGTSAVKALLVDREGNVKAEASRSYELLHPRSGWSEQRPEDWIEGTIGAIAELTDSLGEAAGQIEGISFSGQMHGLILLDESGSPVRNAILWNDTRTTEQCREIERTVGGKLLEIARNPALEGFTLPKILWVRQHEPEAFAQARSFVLPKDYVRYRLTGHIHMDYSDAAGTLLLDVGGKYWSSELLGAFQLEESLCPPLVESHALTGTLLVEIAERTGLRPETKVFAGGADNACGAIGAGILAEGVTLASIGTSGVILSSEQDRNKNYDGKVHFFNHGKENAYYAMGVTLSAGYSLSWFRSTFAPGESFGELLADVGTIPPGSGGLLFTPYLVGERTPHADSVIRGSFIGVDGGHKRAHFARAVMEGITFSLHESVDLLRNSGKKVDKVISIGGGAQNPLWLQMQADIFGATVVALENEQGPGMGAAMLAAYGCGWFDSLEACAAQYVRPGAAYEPKTEAADVYARLFPVYQQVYAQTRSLNESLSAFRN
ncbi:xylulokinase [Paenibacillus sp. GCM10012307]|uniref:Xylulose kinase n=1 Tax=Paenibacillus roseus TaxID=2798579 RepID=A0A934J6V0_9BACL|nr:xylulokinase [Paenibacillus roseus]MBJ6362824.1 xylulokinase [Paenibacillus roseus]